jgi:hypothetical protein
VAELGRQSNILLGHARDEIVAATGAYTPEAVENTICHGLEERHLSFTHGHIEGQLPPGVTDIAFHLFSRRTTDETLKYDFATSSIVRSGPGYSYAVRNIRVERIALMTWCREDNLLLPEELLAPPPFTLTPEFTGPALTQRHALPQAKSFSVAALDFATPALTVRAAPKPKLNKGGSAGQTEPTVANPTKPAARKGVAHSPCVDEKVSRAAWS